MSEATEKKNKKISKMTIDEIDASIKKAAESIEGVDEAIASIEAEKAAQ